MTSKIDHDPGRRRALLVVAAAGAAAMLGPAALVRWLHPTRNGWLGALLDRLHEGDRTAGLGRMYLRSYPEEAGVTALMALVPGVGASRGADGARRMAAAMLSEFQSGQTVRVDGWILSVTEARLLALADAVHSGAV